MLTNPNSLKVSPDFGIYLRTFLVRSGGITAPSNFSISTLVRSGHGKLQTVHRPEPLDTLQERTGGSGYLEVML